MPVDPRLTNIQLLTLAAFRIQQRRQHAVPDWRDTEGLCALLEAAKRLPPCDPQDLPGVYEGAPGLGGLLWAARQQTQEPPPC